jgi:hypothetical protein
MVKKMLFAAALVVALIPFANAQDAKTLTRAITPQTLGAAKVPSAPAVCSPCLFYGGDWPSASTSWVAFGNGNENSSGTVYHYSNYIPFRVSANQVWSVYGLFSNNIFYNFATGTNQFKLDPRTDEWAICQNMVAGTGCTNVASGTATGKLSSTGRSYSSVYFEYSVTASIGKTGEPVLNPGLYWFTVAGDCSDSSCTEFMYNTDTFGGSAYNAFGPAEPQCQSYQNNLEGFVTWQNDCNAGYGKGISAYMSGGVIGKASH